jgi:ribose transport system permease protein
MVQGLTLTDRAGERIRAGEILMKGALYIALLVMVVVLSLLTDKFLTGRNLLNILRQISIQGVIAVGMTMVIITGQIDLSVGSVTAFAAVVVALLMRSGVPIPMAIPATLLISAFWGLVNGFVTAKFKLHAFLVTLGTMTLVRGVTYTLTGGYPVSNLPQAFGTIGGGYLGFLPLPVLYMIAIYAIGTLILKKTPFGRGIHAIGGNAEAARLSGIALFGSKIWVFVITAMLSAVAGIVLGSRLMAGSPEIGFGWELEVIAAVIIGGTNLFGGEGSLVGTFLGVLFIGVLTNGMILLNVTPYMQDVVKGLVIVAAVIINSLEQNRE